MRSPRRTAQTASALMVGLALVAAMSVFGASVSRSATSSVDNAISADLIVTAPARGRAASATSVATWPRRARRHRDLDGLRRPVRVRGRSATLTAVSTRHLADTVILRMTAGGAAALAAGRTAHRHHHREDQAPGGGHTVPVKFAQTGTTTMRIGGIYKPNALIGSYLVSDAFFLSHFSNPLPVARAAADRRQRRAADSAVTDALAAYPNLQIQTRAQFEKSQTARSTSCSGWSTPCSPWPCSSR